MGTFIPSPHRVGMCRMPFPLPGGIPPLIPLQEQTGACQSNRNR